MPDIPPSTNSISTPVDHQPTSTSTTSVVIPTIAQTRSPYLEWDGVVFVIGGVVAGILVLKQILEFLKSILEFIDRKKKKDQEQDAPLVDRMKKLEEQARTFRPKEDIDRDMSALKEDWKHYKNNRTTAENATAERFRRIETQISEDRLQRARLETKVDGMAGNFDRVEGAVERLAERMEDRLDRMQQLFTESRYPAPKSNSANI